jgi:hypothetical protein
MSMFALLAAASLSAGLGIDIGESSIKAAVGTRSGRVHALDAIPNWLCVDHGAVALGDAALAGHLPRPDSCARAISLSRRAGLPSLEGHMVTAIALARLADQARAVDGATGNLTTVVAIPHSLTIRERSVLHAACRIAGLDIAQFVTSSTALAEACASRVAETVGLVDVGQSGTRFSVFRFDGAGGYEQLAADWDGRAGGHMLDLAIAARLSRTIRDDYAGFVDAVQKARVKYTKRGKSVSFKFGGRTFAVNSSVVRDAAADVVDRLRNLLRPAVRLDAVEAFGQLSKVPVIAEAVERELGRPSGALDCQTAAAVGAALFAQSKVEASSGRRHLILDHKVVVAAARNRYPIFVRGDSEEKNPVIVARAHEDTLFEVIDDRNGEVFLRFTLNVGHQETNVEVSFMQNYFLMPVPISAMVDKQEVGFTYQNCGWEVTENDVQRGIDLIGRYGDDDNWDAARAEFKDFLRFLQRKHDTLGYFSLGRPTLSAAIARHRAWLKGIRSGTTARAIRDKLAAVQKEVKEFFSAKELGELDRELAIRELQDLIFTMEIAGKDVGDAKRWLEREKKRATISQIRAVISELEQRNRDDPL